MKLVLLPGMEGTGELFRFFTPHLPPELHAQVIDYPTQQFLDYPQLISYLHERVPADEPYVIFAESFSTPLAVQFAAERPRVLAGPHGLAGIVLCVGFVTSPVGNWARRVPGFIARAVFGLPTSGWVCRHYLAGHDAPREIVEAVRASTGSVHPAVMAERLRIILACDARAALQQVALPMMYLQAAGDKTVGARCGEEIIRLRPQTKLVQLAGPHLLAQREPAATAAALMDFLRRLA